MLDAVDDVKQGETPVDEREKKHCARLTKRIKAANEEVERRAKGWIKAREYADGNTGKEDDNDDEPLVRVNLIGSMLESRQPSLYAKAPEISVEVDDQLDTSQYPMVGKFARTLENALNIYLVKDAKLKKRGKVAVRGALTSTINYVKVIYQKDFKEDPLIRNKINDTQDNIEKIKALIEETKQEGGECNEYEAKMFELNQHRKSLEAQVEIVDAEGLVIDVIKPEDLLILDDSCTDIDQFIQATEIAQRIKMTVGQFKTTFKKNPPHGYKTYLSQTNERQDNTVDEDDKLISVWEVWSLNDLTVYTIVEGSQTYIRPPYQPASLGEQWYPFFGLQFKRVDGVKYPQSMVEASIELQDEYNTIRTNAREHRHKNLPVRVFNKAFGITNEEITAINNRTINTSVIGVTCDAENFNTQLVDLPAIPYDAMMYDPSSILFDLEKVGNTQDAEQGGIRVAKTATEAEIAASGQQGRTSESLDVVEDWLTDISIYSAQLLLQNVSKQDIVRRFGQDAVWPEVDKKTLFEMVNISIRAGSTSKPNKMRERDQWIQLMPEIQKAVETIAMAKQQNNPMLEKITISLLDETLRRFDEKLDAKTLLGLVDEDGNEVETPPAIPPEVEQQIQEMQGENEQLTQLTQELGQDQQNKSRELDIQQQEVDIKAQDSEASQQGELVKLLMQGDGSE